MANPNVPFVCHPAYGRLALLTNAELLAYFLRNPSGPPYRVEEADVAAHILADREVVGEDVVGLGS